LALYFITQAGRGYVADDHALIAELAKLGVNPIERPWTEGLSGITASDTLVIRAIWDYHLRPLEFVAWLDAVRSIGCRMINPEALVRWNYQKTYLRELAGKHIETPETYFFRSATEFATNHPQFEHAEYVLKPVISASAHRTARVAAAHVVKAAQHFGETEFMVQEFLPEISAGEWSLIYIGQEFTHAVRKVPASGEFRSQRDFGAKQQAATPPPSAITQGRRILSLLPEPAAYARIDFVMRGDTPLLIELELIEPELFLANHPQAARQLAQVIARAVNNF
jgi:glutathione synthase/RimK-type ligase-like ATP-grasp enzyme